MPTTQNANARIVSPDTGARYAFLENIAPGDVNSPAFVFNIAGMSRVTVALFGALSADVLVTVSTRAFPGQLGSFSIPVSIGFWFSDVDSYVVTIPVTGVSASIIVQNLSETATIQGVSVIICTSSSS